MSPARTPDTSPMRAAVQAAKITTSPQPAKLSADRSTSAAALEALAAAAPAWLAGVIDASWQEVYGQRTGTLRLPASEAALSKLAEQYGRDGCHLLEAVHAPAAPGWLRELPAVQALRVIWVQQYYRSTDEPGEKVIRREASKHGVPPGRLKLVSPYDPGARYSEKRGKGWAGYKARISETCCEPEPDGTRQAPNLITSVGHHRGDRARRGDDRAHPRHAGGCRAGPRRARGRCRVHLRRPATRRPRPRHHPARPAAVRQPAAGPLRRIHRRDVHHRLGPPASDLPPGRRQHRLEPGGPAREKAGDRGQVRHRHLPRLPGQGPVHHIPHRPPAVPAPPRDLRGRRGRPRRPVQPALETPVQHPRRR